jgi:hypothetical protein
VQDYARIGEARSSLVILRRNAGMLTNLHERSIPQHSLCRASPGPFEKHNHEAAIHHRTCHGACNCMHQ